MKVFYEKQDIDKKLAEACDNMADMIAKQYNPNGPSTDVNNLIAGFVMSARSAMLMAFWDISDSEAKRRILENIDDVYKSGLKGH